MKIILYADVYNLGEEGDICDVARGYARNYLLPKKLAVPYSSQNVAVLESRRKVIEKKKDEKRREALGLKEKIDGTEIEIMMNVGHGGKLFGSVTNTMIADELQKKGIDVEKKRIDIASHSIKMVGTYTVKVKLYENNEAEIKLNVVSQNRPEKDEAETEKKSDKKETPKEAPLETPKEVTEEVTEEAAEEAAEESVPSEEITAEAQAAEETIQEEASGIDAEAEAEPELEAEAADEEEKKE